MKEATKGTSNYKKVKETTKGTSNYKKVKETTKGTSNYKKSMIWLVGCRTWILRKIRWKNNNYQLHS